MGRLLLLLLVTAGVAFAKPAFRPPPPPRTEPAELAARLSEMIRKRDVAGITAMLSDPLIVEGVWFPDAACAKRFGKKATLEKADVRAFAKCLAQLKLVATTRQSSTAAGAILTFEPGVEIEVAFQNDRMLYAGTLWPRDTDRGVPTLTVQAFEALRTAGTTQLDASLANKSTTPLSAWIKVCLDKTGAITDTHFAVSKPPSAADDFRAAIADWKFKPFAKGPACAMTLLSYPATSAPAVEVVPQPPTTVALGAVIETDLVDLYDFNGVAINAAPRSVSPSTLEAQRIRGSRTIDPDPTTKTAIARSATASVTASLKLCIDAMGKVTTVSQLKSSGFPDYDRKLEREMRTWAFKSYRSAPACSAFTFHYRAKP